MLFCKEDNVEEKEPIVVVIKKNFKTKFWF